MGLFSSPKCVVCENKLSDAAHFHCKNCGIELHLQCAKSKGWMREGATDTGGLLSSGGTQFHWDCPNCPHTATRKV